ncbi:ABC transporter substrate-binding protein [Aquabacter spiritensis]|uniref:Amino acid/amide ABC transporter substrate-binding protein (HAAT family) n=1 Tax=Aquabacter spiritensis TaxID=933073 RepID=A0A4R3LPV9_9HYPH|nr:ABC transporter substrate-binding protein [Aquabacter spiritensis]TCT01736.1 amino acid/amide ABC transporter substrate-binding protein (HAAT family) [Aquabacter spiritensis]
MPASLKTSLPLAAVLAALSLAPAFGQETVKIGLIQPLTGSVAYNGVTDVNGAKQAVDARNAAGGVLGKKVELIVEDGQCKPANSVNAAEKLIQRDKVVALVGAFCSSSTLAVMPVAENNKLPLVTGVSSSAALTEKGNTWFFRATETDALLAKSFAKILYDQMKLKKVAYIGVNDDWGRGGVDEFERQMKGLGATTVMKEFFEHGTSDFYTLLTKLRASGADGVFVAAETQDGSIFVKQKAEFGMQLKVFGVGSWATADFIKLTGEASEGIYAAVPYAYTMKSPANQAFVDAYRARYKEAPGKYSAAGFNSLNIVMDAIARAGSTDPEKIREALTKTDYVGPNGRFRFDAKGQAYGFSVVLVQLQKGVPVEVASTSVE